ncbi:MAG: hypothetical protein ACJ8EB_08775 [Allosphingosinicella sp.]
MGGAVAGAARAGAVWAGGGAGVGVGAGGVVRWPGRRKSRSCGGPTIVLSCAAAALAARAAIETAEAAARRLRRGFNMLA